MSRAPAVAAALLVAAAPVPPATTAASFSAAQEAGLFTDEQMAGRVAALDAEAQAADRALNDWKRCVLDSIARWAELKEGPGTLAEGAFGRCSDLEEIYRARLVGIRRDGRALIDPQFARAMIRRLREVWHSRLIAAALEQALAQRTAERVRPAVGRAAPP